MPPCWAWTLAYIPNQGFRLDAVYFVLQSEDMTASQQTTVNHNPRLFALLSLQLLLAALLVPILIAAFGRQEFAFIFGGVAGLLALFFGVLSWSDRIGRTITVALLSVLVVGGGGSMVIYIIRSQHLRAEDARTATVTEGAQPPSAGQK
jgi:hypothetical protein